MDQPEKYVLGADEAVVEQPRLFCASTKTRLARSVKRSNTQTASLDGSIPTGSLPAGSPVPIPTHHPGRLILRSAINVVYMSTTTQRGDRSFWSLSQVDSPGTSSTRLRHRKALRITRLFGVYRLRLSELDVRRLSFRQVNASTLLGVPVVEDGLGRLEPALLDSVSSGEGFFDEVTTHLIKAGGKRLRPALTIASATGCVREATEEDVLGGVSVELVHQASLYHDDVIDEAVMRRQVESVNTRWGNLIAIVAGDFLLARSAEIAASLGQEVAALLANTLARLCEGQLVEIRTKYSIDRTKDDYFEAIAGKTAALMATSCRVGAITSGTRSCGGGIPHPIRQGIRDGVPDPRRHPRRDRLRKRSR